MIEYEGRPIIDPYIKKILETLREKRSLNKVSRSLGISYTSLWDTIARIERILGVKIIETKRGGREKGYTTLTEYGEKLLALYIDAERELSRRLGGSLVHRVIKGESKVVIAHSDDPLITKILSIISEKYEINSLCIGSGMSLAMLSLGEADVACIHLYDPLSGEYNTPYIERFWLKDLVTNIGGFMRQQVLVYRRDLDLSNRDLENVLRRVLRGELVIAMRNRGSGTRILADHLLRRVAEKENIDLGMVRGLEREYYTYEEIARAVLEKRADVAIIPLHIAYQYNLEYIPVTLERYECFARRETINNEVIKTLSSYLEKASDIAEKHDLKGYYALQRAKDARHE